jgi:uncharacterized protein (DUF362 family)
MIQNKNVFVYKINEYDVNAILSLLNDDLFTVINPSDKVVIKPNWVHQSHLDKPNDWTYVITHPDIITAVIYKVLSILNQTGEIVICDAPEGETDFEKLLSHYPVDLWKEKAQVNGVKLSIIDLRDFLWKKKDGIIIDRYKLPGDPLGNIEANLTDDKSEFYLHQKSDRGYYGADFNMTETNQAHDGYNNRYRVSKTVIDADVFINIPKLKTHKKGGITCCLKNLVGINTYKNFLPHHSEGSISEQGDQFPYENLNSRVEGPLMSFLKQNLLQNVFLARIFQPVKKLGRFIFGDTDTTIRSGNWYGNDTLWRMVLDLNKVLFYSETDGSMRIPNITNAKKYIGIVDGILGGQGNGPLYPNPVQSGFLIAGSNPVSIDATCARIIGFDPLKIPSIKNSFAIMNYPLADFSLDDIEIQFHSEQYKIMNFPKGQVVHYEPHFGWKGHIEL